MTKESQLKESLRKALDDMGVWYRKNAGGRMSSGSPDFDILRNGVFMTAELKVAKRAHQAIKNTSLLQIATLRDIAIAGGLSRIIFTDGELLECYRLLPPHPSSTFGQSAVFIRNQMLLHIVDPQNQTDWHPQAIEIQRFGLVNSLKILIKSEFSVGGEK